MPNTNSSSIGNWEMRERGPQDSAGTVLLLPGGLCNTEFLAELMAEPRLSEARLRLVAAALPGHGRQRDDTPNWPCRSSGAASLARAPF